jgi:hypothetical protein
MNLTTLIKTAATRADDLAAGLLWSRAEWIEFANDAQSEACRRARLLVDSTTPAVCSITLVDGTPTYDLHDSIIFVRRVRLLESVDGTALSILKRRHSNDLDGSAGPGWQEEVGQPRMWVPDLDDHKFRPYPIPDTDDWEVSLTVHRTALVPTANETYPMEDGDDEPEIRRRHHLGLVNWMLYRAYSKQDSQCYNPKAAAMFLADFEAEFGKKSSAIDEAWLAREQDFTEVEGNF